MNCVFISDLHIKRPDDLASRIFLEFCHHSHTLHSDKVFLLGDIFDTLIGSHPEYIKKYSFFFEEIEKLLALDKEVIFVEGNHDFHFKGILDKYFAHTPRYSDNFRYLSHGECLMMASKKYFFCHGYEVDYFNKYFKRWHKVYSSEAMKFIANKILTFGLITKLAQWASNDSKKRGQKTFDYSQARAKYLEGAKELIKEKDLAGVIAGHTHIHAAHTFPDGTQYFNCGFPQRDKKFISFKDNRFEMINLEVS